jgi:hypothetical protein
MAAVRRTGNGVDGTTKLGSLHRKAAVCALVGLVLIVAAALLTRVELPRFDHDVPAADVSDSLTCPSVAEEWGTPRQVWDATCQARFTQAELIVLVLGTAGVVLLLVGGAFLLPQLWAWTRRQDEAMASPDDAEDRRRPPDSGDRSRLEA